MTEKRLRQQIRQDLKLPDGADIDITITDSDGDGLPEVSVSIVLGEVRINVLEFKMKGRVRDRILGLLGRFRNNRKEGGEG